MTQKSLKELQNVLMNIIGELNDAEYLTEVKYGNLGEGSFELDGMCFELKNMAKKIYERAYDMEKELDKQTRPDLPHGTIVLCKPTRGEHWVVQLYRKAGCTTDYEGCTSTSTGWMAICPLDKFHPTSRTWMPEPQDDYARREE